MGLDKLLTDLSDNSSNTAVIPNSFDDDRYSPHTITFNQRSMAWPSSYEEGKPLVTFGYDGESFADLHPDSPPQPPEATEFGRGDGGLPGNRRFRDFKRIGKWMFGTGEGRGWITKQMGLQIMNPRLDAPQKTLLDSISDSFTNIFDFSGNAPKDPNQMTYNLGVNTLLSTLMAGAGAIDREGLIPFVHSGYIDAAGKKTWGKPGSLGQSDFDYNAADAPSEGKDTNRLTFLLENKIIAGHKLGLIQDLGLEGTKLGNIMGEIGNFVNDNLGFLGLGGDGEELYSYAGGPNTKYGIGRTSIRRYVNSSVDNYGDSFIKVSNKNPFDGMLFMNPNYIQSLHELGGVSIKGVQQAHPYFQYNTEITDDSGNRTYHRESRVGLGTPGKIIAPVSGSAWNQNKDGTINYKAFVADKVDKVNALDIHHNTDGVFTDNAYRDLIRFRFEAIDNDTPPTAEDGLHSHVMLFRAFIDDISDKYTAEHNNFKYNGRGEEFYTYKSFKRAISISFKIAAQSRHEMMPLYRKLNFLVSNTAPDYSDNGRMRTPYVRMTVGSWMNRIPGVISSIGLSWDTEVPWEINMDGPEDTNPHMLVLPHALDVSLDFIPIHNFLPKKGFRTPFILPNHKDIDGAFKPNQKWLSEGGDSTLNVVKKYLNKATVKRMNDGV